jgi:hypothetical protein
MEELSNNQRDESKEYGERLIKCSMQSQRPSVNVIASAVYSVLNRRPIIQETR